MTREEIEFLAHTEMFTGFKDKLLEHDASQRTLIEQQAKELAELREWKRIILGTGTDQEAVIRMAATAYTRIAVEAWRSEVALRDAEIDRLKVTHMAEIERLKINHKEINVEFNRLNEVITQQMGEIEQLTVELKQLKELNHPICLICGAEKPCALNDDPSPPCTFDMTPKQLHTWCQQLQAQLATANRDLEELMDNLESCKGNELAAQNEILQQELDQLQLFNVATEQQKEAL